MSENLSETVEEVKDVSQESSIKPISTVLDDSPLVEGVKDVVVDAPLVEDVKDVVEEGVSITLKLGDIIEFVAPNNEILNQTLNNLCI